MVFSQKRSRSLLSEAVRPSQIRATAAEAALMVPAAFVASKSYRGIQMPTIILAGEDDRLIDIDEQSARLYDVIKQSLFHRIAGAGHMIQQTETADLMAALDEAAASTLHQPRHVPITLELPRLRLRPLDSDSAGEPESP